jgi:anthranilate phosphoribosyltransferase
MPTYAPSDIFGGNTIESAAEIFVNVLDNKGTRAQKDVVAANSAIAIQCFDQSKDIIDCVNEAIESIESGKAKEALNKIRA